MSSYISSNENRFYVALESTYGAASAITESNRIPAVSLTTRQQVVQAARKDKTGGRTFTGIPSGARTRSRFELKTYMTAWTNPAQPPNHDALFRAALGAAPRTFSGGTVSSAAGTQVSLSAPHGLKAGQAIACGGELRFVAGIVDAMTVQVNAPFTITPQSGSPLGSTVTYEPATQLPTVSVFDYWSPDTAVQRILPGCAIDKLRIGVNGDYHEFSFSGPATDIIDSASFASGSAGLSQFPPEPQEFNGEFAVIPGYLGQAWLGSTPAQMLTLTAAELILENDIDTRSQEFGSPYPRGIVPGRRTVSLDFTLFGQDDAQTHALYQAARQRSPISAMFQLGQQEGQLCGVYMKSIVPEVPEFDDRESRLQWRFSNCRAQGSSNDEITLAFA